MARVLWWDRRRALRPVALQDAEAAQLLARVPEDERMRSWHLVRPGGAVWSGGAAFIPLGRLLPGGKPMSFFASRFPRLARWVYRLVANRRNGLGKFVTAGAARRAQRRIDARVKASRR
jgi:predicted DCC family thiol-disulfide oxidoreductase YuxK